VLTNNDSLFLLTNSNYHEGRLHTQRITIYETYRGENIYANGKLACGTVLLYP